MQEAAAQMEIWMEEISSVCVTSTSVSWSVESPARYVQPKCGASGQERGVFTENLQIPLEFTSTQFNLL